MRTKKFILNKTTSIMFVLLATWSLIGCMTSGAAFGIGVSGGGWNPDSLSSYHPNRTFSENSPCH